MSVVSDNVKVSRETVDILEMLKLLLMMRSRIVIQRVN